MPRIASLLSLLAIVIALQACGNKGPLYLPSAQSAGRRPFGRILKPALGQAFKVAEWRTDDLSSSCGTAG